VEEVDDLGPRHAGEQVLVAARKAHDLVRKGRADDEDAVVFQDAAVQFDRHVAVVAALGQAVHLGGGERAERREGGRQVPLVVEDADIGVTRAFGGRHIEELQDLLFAHRLMGAEGDHKIDLAAAGLDDVREDAEHHAYGGGARRVGDEGKDAPPIKVEAGQGLRAQLSHLGVREHAFLMSSADEHTDSA